MTYPCPACHADLTAMVVKTPAKIGDLTICDHCATILVFDKTLREPTKEELKKWGSKINRATGILQKAVVRRNLKAE